MLVEVRAAKRALFAARSDGCGLYSQMTWCCTQELGFRGGGERVGHMIIEYMINTINTDFGCLASGTRICFWT
jgi:hypothetical protein